MNTAEDGGPRGILSCSEIQKSKRTDNWPAWSAHTSQKVVGNARRCSPRLRPRPSPSSPSKMPSEETKVCAAALVCGYFPLTTARRRESSRLSTLAAYVYDKSLPPAHTHVSSTDYPPLWLDPPHHLRWLHEEQPTTVLDQVSSTHSTLLSYVANPPSQAHQSSRMISHV